MNAVSTRSILLVAALQAIIALAAMSASASAALAAAVIGALSVARYAAISIFAASIASPSKTFAQALSVSAWIFSLAALVASLAAVAFRARPALSWAVAAAFAGPLGMTFLALGSGIAAASHAGGKR